MTFPRLGIFSLELLNIFTGKCLCSSSSIIQIFPLWHQYCDPLTHILALKHLFKKIYCALTKIDTFQKDTYFKYRTTIILAKIVDLRRMPSLPEKPFWCIHELLLWLWRTSRRTKPSAYQSHSYFSSDSARISH